MGIQPYFKGGKTIKIFLLAPKDKDTITQKSGVFYRYKCDMLDCGDEYIGESIRTFGERLKEHFRAPSLIYDHANITCHHISVDSFSIVGRESHNLTRTIKEAMYTRVNDPSLNRNMRKLQLFNIWDGVLLNTPDLKPSRPYNTTNGFTAPVLKLQMNRRCEAQLCHHIPR